MITYGGIPLGQPTPNVAAFVDAHPMDLQKPQGFDRTVWTDAQEQRHGSVKLNHLYWPVGASRWAFAHCLANQRMLRDIRLQAYTSANANRYRALPFTMTDDMGGEVTTSLYLLPPRPLNTMAGGEFWLLELVDERFFWWEIAANIEIDEGTTTWAELLGDIADAIGISLTLDTISSGYLTPAATLVRPYAPLPVLLDLAAQSIGHRVVRNLAGAVKTQTPNNARAAQNAQLLTAIRRCKAAGGNFHFDGTRPNNDLAGRVPASVTVTFPRTDNDILSLTPYTVTKTLTSLEIAEYGRTVGHPETKIIESTAVARFLAAALLNEGELDLAASVIAEDWYRWQLAKVNARYDGIHPWPADAFSDHVEWSSLPGGASTRVQRPEEPEGLIPRLHLFSSQNVSIVINPTIIYDTINNILKVYNSITNVWVSFCPCDPPPPDSCTTVECCPDYCIPLVLCVTSINESCPGSSDIPPDFELEWTGKYWYGETSFGDYVTTLRLECIDGDWRLTMTIDAGRAYHNVTVWEAADLTIDCGPPLSIQASVDEGFHCTFDWSIDVCTTGATVTVGCCANPIAATLHANLDALVGAACMDGQDVELTFVPGSDLYGGGTWSGCTGDLGGSCGKVRIDAICQYYPPSPTGYYWTIALFCAGAAVPCAEASFIANTLMGGSLTGTGGPQPSQLDVEDCDPIELQGDVTINLSQTASCAADGDTVRVTITE